MSDAAARQHAAWASAICSRAIWRSRSRSWSVRGARTRTMRDIHGALGLLDERLGKDKEADKEYRTALRARAARSRSCSTAMRYTCAATVAPTRACAISSRPRAIRCTARPGSAYTNAGVCLRQAHHDTEAAQRFARALQIQPGLHRGGVPGLGSGSSRSRIRRGAPAHRYLPAAQPGHARPAAAGLAHRAGRKTTGDAQHAMRSVWPRNFRTPSRRARIARHRPNPG